MLKQKETPILFTIILIGLCFRLFLIFDLPIWLDESFTLNHIKLSWLEIIGGKFDPTHPFAYYLFLKLWSTISTSLHWLRISTLIFYFINSILLWKIFVITKQKKLGFFILILYAFSGYFIIFDWQTRMYTGVLTLILASWHSLQTRRTILFFLINTIGLYFDYAFFWYLFPLTFLIFHQFIKDLSHYKKLLLSIVFSWLAFAFWIPTFSNVYKDGIEGISWASRFVTPVFFLPYFLGSHTNFFIGISMFFLSLLGIFISFRDKKKLVVFFIIAGLFSGASSYIISFFVGSIFHVRNLQIIALMFLIVLAVFLDWSWKKGYKNLVLIFFLFYFLNFLFVIQMHYLSPGLLLLKF